ncbi:MAG: gluconokinase [Actinomycetota bacterium]|nr:gluconokinase [Actinomycetota bacterium]
MPDAVVGLDIGTTSTKALALEDDGRVCAVAQHEAAARRDDMGHSEQDPELVYQAALRCLAEVAGAAKRRGLAIAGIATSAAMHSLLALDEQGAPLTGAVTWGDNRAIDQARALKRDADPLAIYRRTGVPVHPMTPLVKLLWFRDRAPDIFARAVRWISIKEYVLARLCGDYFVDYSTAAASGLLSIESRDWDADLLGLLDVKESQFSKPVPPEYVGGTLAPEVAAAVGLDPSCRVIAGGSDGACANVGVGAIDPGVVACSIGTSGAVRTFAARPRLDPEGRLFCYPFDTDRYLIGGPINNGGVALQWVRDRFFPELVSAEARGGGDAYQSLESLAESVQPGAEGLVFLPYLLGERAPHWNPEASGVLFGLRLEHERAHVVRATLEGVVYQLHLVVRLLEQLVGEVTEVRATGGFARAPIWCQIMADVSRHEVHVPVSEHGSAIGAAVVGLKALGITTSLAVVDVEQGPRFVPTKETADVYGSGMALFERLYHRLEPEFGIGEG